jgi:hypothetical protein
VNQRRGSRSISTYSFTAFALAIAAVGCAGQTPAAHDARAAGEWTFRLPETGSPYAGLAIASPGQQTGLNLVDDALATPAAKTETAATPKARPVTQPRNVVAKNTQPAAAPAPQPAAATPPSTPAVAATQPEQLALNTPPVPNASEEMRYSQREQQSQKQRDFRGGDAIVISASALVIILLVVILILLLT